MNEAPEFLLTVESSISPYRPQAILKNLLSIRRVFESGKCPHQLFPVSRILDFVQDGRKRLFFRDSSRINKKLEKLG